ncbi:cytochrome P450 [Xylaria flabelliformis]|nr:cytochrome P450 [Xylaria flabelliformis]
MAIVASGYKKFQERPFVVRRYDADITILPHKYLSEMRLMPAEKLSAVRVQVKNMAHKYTKTSFLMDSDLHFRVLQNKLTPELPKYLDMVKKEISNACATTLPQTDDWTEVGIQPLMRMVVARITSAVMVGYPVARDPEWLNLIIDYPGDMLEVAYTLRRFPPWMHYFVALFLPARYRLASKYKVALRILSPVMNKLARLKRLGSDGIETVAEEDDTLLNWMLDRGDEKETRYEEMAARQVLLSLASIHTTSMTVSNILYDLCEHPEWFSVLRAEIEATANELGPMGSKVGIVQWLFKLEKMNSFIVETQRLRPPIILSPQREAMEPLTLSDGTYIPKGSRISWAAYNHINSHAVTPDPENFDPMRSYRKRHAAPDERNKHLAGQTDVNNLTFGYGKLACPGRAFAISEVQMILVKILMDFDFKFPTGKGRPKDMFADEQMFPDPSATIMIRRRGKGSPLE